jgi:hypothetical protein
MNISYHKQSNRPVDDLILPVQAQKRCPANNDTDNGWNTVVLQFNFSVVDVVEE